MPKEFTLDNVATENFSSCWDYTERVHRSGLNSFPPAIIACAITGSNQGKEANPNLPETVDEQVQSTYEAYKAGAVMVHIHRRDPNAPHAMSQDPEMYREVNIKIREKCPDIIINNTAGCGCVVDANTRMRSQQIMPSVYADPEVATIDTSTYCSYVKLPPREGVRDEAVFRELIYTMTHNEAIAALKEMAKRKIKPEFECFAIADLWYLTRLQREPGGFQDYTGGPSWLNFVFTGGSNWPTPNFINTVVQNTPRNTILGIIATGAQQWPVLAQALCHGCHVRVGMEDNVYYAKGQLAQSNAQLVEKIVKICDLLDRKRATVEEARKMLHLGPPRKWN
ncbi:MAG: 3-keto-5-aminohexanoate cleavage protein [Oscillospiraceae bacterium]